MNLASILQYAAFLALTTVSVKPVGDYLERVFSRKPTKLDRFLAPAERMLYRFARVDPEREMDWVEYAVSFALFTLAGSLLLYLILRAQRYLPFFFPEYQNTPLTPDLAMNTAVSSSTTTTWQAYAGKNTMSCVSQIVGLCTQNFSCRCGRTGGRHRLHPGICPPALCNHREFLGRSHTLAFMGIVAGFGDWLPAARGAGCADELEPLCRSDDR